MPHASFTRLQFCFKAVDRSLPAFPCASLTRVLRAKGLMLITLAVSLSHPPVRPPFRLLAELTIKKCPVDIKSIELQLVRVETCAYMEGDARELTEIQNIQVCPRSCITLIMFSDVL